MFRRILAGVFAAAITLSLTPTVEAGHRGFVPRRVVNSYQRDIRSFQRDVRGFQRQTSRSFNQINRGFSRSIRRAPQSSGVFLGGPRGGVYFRF